MNTAKAILAVVAWELAPVPSSDPGQYVPVQLYRDGIAWPVPIPAAPADDDPMCVMWPEWCEARRAARDAALALNAAGLAEIRVARSHGDPDFNGDGEVDSQDFFDFMATWGPVANGGTP